MTKDEWRKLAKFIEGEPLYRAASVAGDLLRSARNVAMLMANTSGDRMPGCDADGKYSTAQMLTDEATMGDTSKPLFD